jgi:hypothetical protein
MHRVLAPLVLALTAFAQTPAVENQFVRAIDVTVPSGGTLTPDNTKDTLIVYLSGDTVGKTAFFAKGQAKPLKGVAHVIQIELSDAQHPKYTNPTKYLPAMPRPRAIKLFENNRVSAWDYTWNPGEATPMHFHDKDVVITYLAKGNLKSTNLDGTFTNNPHYFGFTKFNPGNRTHTETLTEGEGRAIILELK